NGVKTRDANDEYCARAIWPRHAERSAAARDSADDARQAGDSPVAGPGRAAWRVGLEGSADRSRMARPDGRGKQSQRPDCGIAPGALRSSWWQRLDRNNAPPRVSVYRAGR